MHIKKIGQGKDLVLIHGWGMHSGIWEPIIDRFSKAIDRVSTVSIEKSRAVKLSLINNLLSLNVSSHDLGNASEELEIDYNYDNLEIGFNAKYLLDIAAQIQGKEIEILLSDSASPALITDPDQDGVIFVLMPMRV